MTTARRTVVLESDPGIYHCISRCVRRAYLCGWDAYSGNSYEHRKEWVQKRVRELSGLFAIEVCAYAVMSNHLHLVLKCDPQSVWRWSDREVARRWVQLFPGGRDSRGASLSADPVVVGRFLEDPDRVQCCRKRLGNLSWFMRSVNETIARRANREDKCTGRFWEGRFKCQRLEDDGSIVACMAYVDLNPVRADLADCPEASKFTSVYDRLRGRQGRHRVAETGVWTSEGTREQRRMLKEARRDAETDLWLCPIEHVFSRTGEPARNVDLDSYLALVDWTGRQMKLEKSGAVPHELASILERLDLDTDNWVRGVKRYGSLYYRVAGRADRIAKAAKKAGQRWFRVMPPQIPIYRARTA